MLVLDPRWTSDFQELARELDHLGLRPFETYRTDDEQLRVFNLGMSKARPGDSPHQWGLAVDFVPWDGQKFHWPKSTDGIWKAMHYIVDTYGQLSYKSGPDIPWDSPHVQVVNWRARRSEKHRQYLRQWQAKNLK